MQYFQVNENDRLKRRIYLHLVDATDGITPETGEASGTAKVSLNGNTPTTSINSLVPIDTTNQPGTYYLELSPTEIQFPGIVSVRYKSANTAEFVVLGQIMAFDPYTQFGTLSGGGADVDYKRIKKLMDEAVGSIPKPPEPKEFDPVPLSEGLQAVIQEIRDIKFPEQKEANLLPLLARLQAIQNSINNLKFPECDHKEVMKRLDEHNLALDANTEQLERHVEEIIEPLKHVLSKDNDLVKDEMRKLGEKFEGISYAVVDKTQRKEQPKASVLDEYLNLP
jgi:hypothetical protein